MTPGGTGLPARNATQGRSRSEDSGDTGNGASLASSSADVGTDEVLSAVPGSVKVSSAAEIRSKEVRSVELNATELLCREVRSTSLSSPDIGSTNLISTEDRSAELSSGLERQAALLARMLTQQQNGAAKTHASDDRSRAGLSSNDAAPVDALKTAARKSQRRSEKTTGSEGLADQADPSKESTSCVAPVGSADLTMESADGLRMNGARAPAVGRGGRLRKVVQAEQPQSSVNLNGVPAATRNTSESGGAMPYEHHYGLFLGVKQAGCTSAHGWMCGL
jgi:hypothetical protein